MCACRASIRRHVAVRTTTRARAGITAHAISPRGEDDGTSSDLLLRLNAKVDRNIAISAMTHATAAIQKTISANG